MSNEVIRHLIEHDVLAEVDGDGIDAYLEGQGLRVLFFAGMSGQHGNDQGHDVAVALRELLKDYPTAPVAVVSAASERTLMARFRVAVLPSLVFVVEGENLEVLPRVRDWSDYQAAFERYLGPADRCGARIAETGEVSS